MIPQWEGTGEGGRTRNYWWPGVTKEVGRYVDRCNAC